MKTINEYSFRELNNQYIFVYTDTFNYMLQQFFPMPDNTNGFLAYCYLDHEQGMGVEVLQTGFFDSEAKALKLEKENIDNIIRMELEELAGCEAMLLPSSTPFFSNFAGKIAQIQEDYAANAELEITRRALNLDSCRQPYAPDTITVKLIKGEEIAEDCQILVEGTEQLGFFGTLLTEPENNFGVHLGDTISFYNVKNQLGIMCIAVYQ